jgi:lipopolysaccharide transport system permease protein
MFFGIFIFRGLVMDSIIFWHRLKNILGLGISLAKAQFKLRNEGSYLGILWYVMEPFLMFIILLTVFSKMVGQSIPHYPLYLLLGLIIFNFFSRATSSATDIISSNAGFIKSIKLNYESMVIANLLQHIVSHIFEILIFALFLIYYDIAITYLLFYPIMLAMISIFILGLSFILSTCGAYFNDLKNIWRVVSRVLWFITPIFYIVDKPGLIFLINPMFYFINISRSIFIYHKIPSLSTIAIITVFSIVFLIFGLILFEKNKKNFAQIV